MLTRFYAGAIAFLDGTISGAWYQDEVLTPYPVGASHFVITTIHVHLHARRHPHPPRASGNRVSAAAQHSGHGLATALTRSAWLARQVPQIGPATKTELREAILQAWYAPQTLAVVKKLYASLPRWMTALKRSKKAHIRY